MPGSRREFLTYSSLGLLGAALQAQTGQGPAIQVPPGPSQQPSLPPGAPPAFGTAAPVGPAVSSETFAEAEKLVQVEMTPADRAVAAGNWQMQMAPVYELRTGPRKMALPATLAPATQWNPDIAQVGRLHEGNGAFVRSAAARKPLPSSDEDIA